MLQVLLTLVNPGDPGHLGLRCPLAVPGFSLAYACAPWVLGSPDYVLLPTSTVEPYTQFLTVPGSSDGFADPVPKWPHLCPSILGNQERQ